MQQAGRGLQLASPGSHLQPREAGELGQGPEVAGLFPGSCLMSGNRVTAVRSLVALLVGTAAGFSSAR